MRRRTTFSARWRQAPAVLLAAIVLTVGSACSWGDGDASGGDTAQTDTDSDGGGTNNDGGDTDTDGEDTDNGEGGAQPSPIRVSRATEQIGNQVPVGVVADQAAADMATECPGGELCVEIDIEPDDPTCQYAGAEPAAGELIDVGATLTLFGDCDVHLEPDPNQEGSYIVVGGGPEGPEGTDGTKSTDGTDGESSEDDQG